MAGQDSETDNSFRRRETYPFERGDRVGWTVDTGGKHWYPYCLYGQFQEWYTDDRRFAKVLPDAEYGAPTVVSVEAMWKV